VRNKNKLSFGDGESASSDDAATSKFGKAKSAHDALNDPRLSKEAAYVMDEPSVKRRDAVEKSKKQPAKEPLESKPPGKRQQSRLQRPAGDSDSDACAADFGRSGDMHEDDDEADSSSDDAQAQALTEKRQQEILNLKRQIAGISGGAVASEAKKPQKEAKTELEKRRLGYETRQKQKKAVTREEKRDLREETVGALKGFSERLKEAVTVSRDAGEAKNNLEDVGKDKEVGTLSAIWEEGDDEGDDDWLAGGGLKFHTSADKAFKMESIKARENFKIFDPLAASGNNEIVALEKKKRTDNLRVVPSMRRNAPLEKW